MSIENWMNYPLQKGGTMNLKHLADAALLEETKILAHQERQVTLKILHHLREIERRRLYAELGHGSLFEYAVKELGYSEPSASRRIYSARLLKDFPEIEKKLEQGKLTITNVALAAQTFKNEKIDDRNLKKESLLQIENKSKRDCEKKILEFLPPNAFPKEVVKVISPTFYSVHLNLSEKTMTAFNQLKDLLSHKRLGQNEIVEYAMNSGIQRALGEKHKLNAKLSTPGAKPCVSRHIQALTKKRVYLRDQGQCTNCKSSYKLEYDHVIPYSHGGKSTVENLRLLCFSCNQRRLKI
jgi:hypothetical protein